MAFATYELADGRVLFLGVAATWQAGQEAGDELYSPGWLLRREGTAGETWTEALSVRDVIALAPDDAAKIFQRSQALLQELRIQMRRYGLDRERVYVQSLNDYEREIEDAAALV